MPAETATFRPVASRTRGTSSRIRSRVRSSGPRTARTMQNSVAPAAAVSAAAASTSPVSRKGVAFTGVSKRDDWAQKWQSSGHPPVLADRIPSTSTSGPHQARRTSWAREASAVTDSSGTTARRPSSAAREGAALVEEGRRGGGDEGAGHRPASGGAGRTTGQASTGARRETVLRVGVRDGRGRPPGTRASAHGSGRRPRGGKRRWGGTSRRSRSTRPSWPGRGRSSTEEVLPLETLDARRRRPDWRVIRPAPGGGEGAGDVGRPPPAGAGGDGLRPGEAGAAPRDPGPDAARAPRLREQRPRLGQRRAPGHRASSSPAARTIARRWLQPLLDGEAAQRLLHDRARGGGRSHPDPDVGRPRRRASG